MQQTILLVEDDEMIRSLIAEVLGTSGYRMIEAEHGADALQIGTRQGEPIHLLITDLIMPGMDGLELAERLAAIRPDMRVLFMSGYPNRNMLPRDLRPDGAEFLQKPFQLDTLARKVRQILNRP